MLHPQLKKDCIYLGKLNLCHLLLMNDSQYPWCILVPDRDGVEEIYQLTDSEQQMLIHESSMLAKALMEAFKGDKMNIGALGNVVPQLHVHHIVRLRDDMAWPGPVWGRHPARAYTDEQLEKAATQIKNELGSRVVWSDGI